MTKFVTLLALLLAQLIGNTSATTMTVIPSGHTLTSGTPVTLTCNSGDPAERNIIHTPVGSFNGSTYHFFATTSHSGRFHCCNTYTVHSPYQTTCNSGGYPYNVPCTKYHFNHHNECSSSKTITVVVPDPPTLSADKTTPIDGDVIKLTCATGQPYVTSYKFLKDNIMVQSSDSNTLTFPAQSVLRDGRYTCTATSNTFTSRGSNAVLIQVRPKTPSLVAAPADTHVTFGGSIALVCQTATIGTVNYTFLHDGHVKPTSLGNTLVLSQVTSTDSGAYTCTAAKAGISSAPSMAINVNVAARATTTVTTTTRRPLAGFHCETGPNAADYYVFIYDKTQYVHCEADGKAYLETCPATTVWDQLTHKCVPGVVVG